VSEWPHASPAADLADDPSIPLLTDRIFLPAVELDTALPASLAGAPASEGGEAAEPIAAEEPPAAAPAEPQPLPEAKPPEGTDVQAIEIAGAEAAIEVELDRDLVAASDADFDALLSAEQPLAPAEAAVGAAAEPPPAASPLDVHAAVESPTAAPAFDQAALETQAEALSAAVLQRVTARLPEQVNIAVRDLMQPAIDQAMTRLGEEAEVALRITLQELVEQALREELARYKGSDAAQ